MPSFTRRRMLRRSPPSIALVVPAGIASGKLHPFQAPVRDNDGKERLAAGQTLTDDQLSAMDYPVEGVQGKLPAAK